MALVSQPDGTYAWVDDATGEPAFAMPQQAGGPAALLAMQADVDAGVTRPPGYYGGLAAGRAPSMATSPGALAQGPAPSYGGDDKDAADFAAAAAAPPQAPASNEHPDPFAKGPAFDPWAPPKAPASPGGSDASFAAAASKAAIEQAPADAEMLAKVNANRAKSGLAPYVDDGSGRWVQAPPGAKGEGGQPAAPTGKVVMAGGQPSAGASGQGGSFDPYAAWKAQQPAGGGRGGNAGMVPTSMSVQKEGTQSIGTLDEQIRAGAAVTKAQQGEAATREAGAKAASAVYDKQAAEDREVGTALQASAQNLADKTRVGLEEIQRKTAELASAEVDPGRYWKSLGPGGQLAKTLAVVGGAIGAWMMKSNQNLALDIITKQVDQDIEAQRNNIDLKRKSLGDEEKMLQLNKQRFESDASALDAQRAYGLKAAAAKLESIKQQTQSALERDSIATMQAQLQQRAADLIAGVEAKQQGTVSQSFKYAQPGGGGSKALSFDQMLAYGKYLQDRGGKQAPLNTVTGPDGTVYTISAGEGESGKLRETQGIINSTFDQIRTIHPSASDTVINPKLASTYARIVGAGVNKAIGEGSMTKDNEEAYARDLTGMRADEAQKFTENFLRNISERRIQQVATGVIDQRTGAVTPLAGRERMAPR